MPMLPLRGPSIEELHEYFAGARRALEAVRGGYDRDDRQVLHGKCVLYADRLIRAPAARVDDILLKLQAADWLGTEPREMVALIRGDLERIRGASR